MKPVGFMVIRREDRPGPTLGQLFDDWDAEVHPTQAAANQSCIEAKQAGWDCFTVALFARRQVNPRSHEKGDKA